MRSVSYLIINFQCKGSRQLVFLRTSCNLFLSIISIYLICPIKVKECYCILHNVIRTSSVLIANPVLSRLFYEYKFKIMNWRKNRYLISLGKQQHSNCCSITKENGSSRGNH
jgi:hypothetical protein